MSVLRYTQDHRSRIAKNDTWDASQVDGFPWLYIGSLSAAESHHNLRMNNVTRVLTVARRLPVDLPVASALASTSASASDDSIVEINHCIVEIDDHPRANFLDVAACQCRDFINDAFAAASKYHVGAAAAAAGGTHHPPSILVHCASGVSRSATAILTWLMDPKQGFSLNEALASIRTNRPTINPNIGFMMQMQVLEKNHGDLSKSIIVWNANTKTEIYERVSSRRQKANDMHAEIDELEVQIQTFQSSKSNDTEKIKNNSNNDDDDNDNDTDNDTVITLSYLQRELNQIIDRLDIDCQENSIGCTLPEDRVSKMIFKSVRSKVNRLDRLVFSWVDQI